MSMFSRNLLAALVGATLLFGARGLAWAQTEKVDADIDPQLSFTNTPFSLNPWNLAASGAAPANQLTMSVTSNVGYSIRANADARDAKTAPNSNKLWVYNAGAYIASATVIGGIAVSSIAAPVNIRDASTGTLQALALSSTAGSGATINGAAGLTPTGAAGRSHTLELGQNTTLDDRRLGTDVLPAGTLYHLEITFSLSASST